MQRGPWMEGSSGYAAVSLALEGVLKETSAGWSEGCNEPYSCVVPCFPSSWISGNSHNFQFPVYKLQVLKCKCCVCLPAFSPDSSFFLGEEDRGRWVWGDLRGARSADAGQCGAEGGISPAAQTGAEDGGRCPEKAAG